MLTIAVLAALAQPAAPVPPAPPAASQDGASRPIDALVRACAPLAEAESYRFTMTTESDGGAGGSGGFGGFGGRGGEALEPPWVAGRVVKEMPMSLIVGESELFKFGDKVVLQDEEGSWTLAPTRTRGRRGGGRPERGAGEPRGPRPEGQRPENQRPENQRGEGQRRGGRGAFGGPTRMLRSFVAPHTLVGNLANGVTDVAKAEGQDGAVVFSGRLSEDAIARLAGFGGGRGGRGGRGGQMELEQSGTFEVTLDPQGAVTEIGYSVRTQAWFGDREIDRTRTTTFNLSGIGETKVDVPAEVAELLGYAPKPAESEDDWF